MKAFDSVSACTGYSHAYWRSNLYDKLDKGLFAHFYTGQSDGVTLNWTFMHQDRREGETEGQRGACTWVQQYGGECWQYSERGERRIQQVIIQRSELTVLCNQIYNKTVWWNVTRILMWGCCVVSLRPAPMQTNTLITNSHLQPQPYKHVSHPLLMTS